MDPIEQAFAIIPRRDFLPPAVVDQADRNIPLPIGYGQTNSQPETVQSMLKWLDVQPADQVLDVGSGSGWTSALLGQLVGPKGHVTAVEIIPELVAFGRDNCTRLGITNISFHQAVHIAGWPDEAPYDKILVSAAAPGIPQALLSQLKHNGRMVVPVRNSIFIMEKDEQGIVEQTEHRGFVFVPLTIQP